MTLSTNLKTTLLIAAILSTPSHAAKNLRNAVTRDDKEVATTTTREMLQSRIVGGNQAQPGAYPYFTQLVNVCGASLIHEDIILSAAHCNELSETRVIVGDFEGGKTGYGAVARTIVKRAVHPKYNSNTNENDFLILKLNSPVTTIKPVTLNRSNASPVKGENVVVVGLGALTENGNSPQFLHEVTVQAVDQATCNREYGGGIFEASMVCAAVVGGGKDSCQGDSGGPLVRIVNGEHIQVGVVSWGDGCARPSLSGIYSRVSGEIAWIEQQICLMSANPPSRCTIAKPVTPAPALSNARFPTAKPTTAKPTVKPVTNKPTTKATTKPTLKPTRKPTRKPTEYPTATPSFYTDDNSSPAAHSDDTFTDDNV